MITKEQYWDYEECRLSGVTNMFLVKNVEEITGLSREDQKEIRVNYRELTKKYNPERYKRLTK